MSRTRALLVDLPSRAARAPASSSVRGFARRGFSLLEVAIGLLLLGLLLAVAGPALSGLAGVELRGTTSQIQGLVRDTYMRVAVSGKPHRIVFDLEADAFAVEVAEGPVALKVRAFEPDRDGKGTLFVEDERLEGTEDSDDVEDQEKRRLWAPPMWAIAEDPIVTYPVKLPTDVHFHSFWADHLTEAITGGIGALHFFPGGTMQEAHITLTDDESGERSLTIVTEPLTGETFVEETIPRVPS